MYQSFNQSINQCKSEAAVLLSSHRLKVLVSESQRIGVAKLAENFPRSFVTTSLDEQLVQEQKSWIERNVHLSSIVKLMCT